MKHLFFCLMLCSTATLAQNFAPVGAKWYYDSSLGGATPRFGAYRLYEVTKDTLINGQSCRLIKQSRHAVSGMQNLADVYVYEANDTVFYYHTTLQRFSPLYMLNVQVGDTLTFDVPAEFPAFDPAQTHWQAVADSIVPLVIAGDTVRSFYTTSLVDNNFNFTPYGFHGPYLEKIGSTFLLTPQPLTIIPEWDGGLRCYEDAALSVNLMQVACDFLTASSVAENRLLQQVRFFPNPAQSELRLENNNQQEVTYELHDVQGRLLLAGQLQPGSQSLGLQGFQAGMYLLQFRSESQIRTERLLISR
ncbi:MAG: T9SS type A sorting domain-containing protein [Bacteroidia bacterium]